MWKLSTFAGKCRITEFLDLPNYPAYKQYRYLSLSVDHTPHLSELSNINFSITDLFRLGNFAFLF